MTTPEKTIRRESILLRVLWMLLFLLVWQVAVPLLALLVVAQLLYRLFYGAPSGLFMSFGDSLSQYLAQIGRFAVFNTDERSLGRLRIGQLRALPKASLRTELKK